MAISGEFAKFTVRGHRPGAFGDAKKYRKGITFIDKNEIANLRWNNLINQWKMNTF